MMYMENYAKPHKKTWRQDLRRLITHIIPVLGEMKLIDITQLDIVKFHSSFGSRNYMANRCLEQLAKMFKLAVEWEQLPEWHKLPTAGVIYFPEVSRERFVTEKELGLLAHAINTTKSQHIRVLVWLYLLLGLRKTELLSIRWSDIDWELKELTIGETKNGHKHYLPLSNVAISLLHGLPRINKYVFPGNTINAPMTSFEKSWRSIKARAGLKDLRLHDLRRTVGSWLAQSGEPIELIGKVLNHKCHSSTLIYARFQNDDVKEALQKHASVIERYMG